MTHVQHLQPFLRKTPFHEPMERLMHGNGWIRWMGFLSPAFYDSEQSEYFAVRTGASVYDVSPLIKYSIRGKDAARYVDYLVTCDITKVKPQQVVYTAWCDDDGKMIEEGTIFFACGPDDFILNAAPAPSSTGCMKPLTVSMSQIEEISDQLAGLALQGPTSRDILKALGVAGIENLPHFGILETRLDGRWLRIDRAGYTGDLGYELWVKPQDAIWLWDTLFKLGEPYKIAPLWVSKALDMTRIEAGFILVDADYIGAMHAIRLSQRQSPIEAGIGWAVGFKKQRLFHRQARAHPRKDAGPLAPHPGGHRDRGPQARPRGLSLCRQGGKARDRAYHLGPVVAGLEEEHRLCPRYRFPAFAADRPRDVGRDLVPEGKRKSSASMMRCWTANRMFFDPPRKKQ